MSQDKVDTITAFEPRAVVETPIQTLMSLQTLQGTNVSLPSKPGDIGRGSPG